MEWIDFPWLLPSNMLDKVFFFPMIDDDGNLWLPYVLTVEPRELMNHLLSHFSRHFCEKLPRCSIFFKWFWKTMPQFCMHQLMWENIKFLWKTPFHGFVCWGKVVDKKKRSNYERKFKARMEAENLSQWLYMLRCFSVLSPVGFSKLHLESRRNKNSFSLFI